MRGQNTDFRSTGPILIPCWPTYRPFLNWLEEVIRSVMIQDDLFSDAIKNICKWSISLMQIKCEFSSTSTLYSCLKNYVSDKKNILSKLLYSFTILSRSNLAYFRSCNLVECFFHCLNIMRFSWKQVIYEMINFWSSDIWLIRKIFQSEANIFSSIYSLYHPLRMVWNIMGFPALWDFEVKRKFKLMTK